METIKRKGKHKKWWWRWDWCYLLQLLLLLFVSLMMMMMKISIGFCKVIKQPRSAKWRNNNIYNRKRFTGCWDEISLCCTSFGIDSLSVSSGFQSPIFLLSCISIFHIHFNSFNNKVNNNNGKENSSKSWFTQTRCFSLSL